jgi:hypothetical protein
VTTKHAGILPYDAEDTCPTAASLIAQSFSAIEPRNKREISGGSLHAEIGPGCRKGSVGSDVRGETGSIHIRPKKPLQTSISFIPLQ